MSLQTGQILQGRYAVDSHVGAGGMGTVYRAHDLRLDNRPVAVKELDPEQIAPSDRQVSLQAFEQEAGILAKLSHPGLTAVHDYFPENNKFYLVMEFVPGETLEQAWVRAGRHFPETQVVTWAQELCDVLTYLHTQYPPIIFRDLKPENIMLQPNGRLKLIDFGIARHFDPDKTKDTTIFGTPGYAAPEQYGHGQTDARSDIYSLGVVVHHLLTGYEPGMTPFNLPDIGTFSLQISEPVKTAVRQAVQLDPNDRPPTVEAWRQLLTAKNTILPTSGKPNWKVLAIVAVVLLAIIFGGFGVWRAQNNTPPPVEDPEVIVESVVATETPAPPIEPTEFEQPNDEPTNPPPPTEPVAEPTSTFTPTATATSTETPKPTATVVVIGDGRRQTAVLVPAGEFEMGTAAERGLAECNALLPNQTCQLNWFTDENPVHTVYLDEFYVDQYEVTNADFINFLNNQSNPLGVGNDWLDFDSADGSGPIWASNGSWQTSSGWETHPVVYVTWYGARAYCSWQNGRLPTEAEWEKAARGPEDDRLYPWGNSYSTDRANICDTRCREEWANNTIDDGYATTAPVGSYPNGTNIYGLHDMSGNAFEWTADWYSGDYYSESPASNPPGPPSGQWHVVRGGSFLRNGRAVRLSYRYGYKPDFGFEDVGFRCVYDS